MPKIKPSYPSKVKAEAELSQHLVVNCIASYAFFASFQNNNLLNINFASILVLFCSLFMLFSLYFPKIYFRYVDDDFAVFDDNPAVDSFLNVLNNLHNYIKFTVEKSAASIHFLDVDMKVNNDGTSETCVWRKPTHTGLFLNFNAACHVKWKSG